MSAAEICTHAQKVMINCEDQGSVETYCTEQLQHQAMYRHKQQALLKDVSQQEPSKVVASSRTLLHAVRVFRTGTASAQALAAVLAALPRLRSFRLASE